MMYLRSKDDNLILLTTGVLLYLLSNKGVSLPLLEKVNLFPKSRIAEIMQDAAAPRSKSFAVHNEEPPLIEEEKV